MSRPDSHAQHLARWDRMLTGRSKWTQEAWLDVRFEAGKTWTLDELLLFERQGRAASNYNLIRPTVELLCGIEQSTRSKPVARPRTRAMVESAEGLTELIAYVDNQNDTPRHISNAFRQAAITGRGWLEAYRSEEPMAEMVGVRSLNTFDVWVDPTCKAWDLGDALDVCRAMYVHPAWLALKFPGTRGSWEGDGMRISNYSHTADYTNKHGDAPPVELFNGGVGASPHYGPGHGLAPVMFRGQGYGQDLDFLYRMDRYEGLELVVERWYRCDEWARFARFRDGRVMEVAPHRAEEIAAALVSGQAQLFQAILKRMRCGIFTQKGVLVDYESPHRFNDFPFVQVLAYQDDEYQPRGIVASLRDPQKEFNARRTLMLRNATQNQVFYESGQAFEDESEARRELAKPNGFVRLKPGAMMGRRFEVRPNTDANAVQADMMTSAAKMIQDMSGITAELLGQETNASSGKAIQARQSQGQTAMFSLFENRNWAQKALAERTMSLIQQYYTDEMELRITGKDRPGLDFITLNRADGQNDITQARFDLVMDSQPSTPTQRMQRLEALSTFLGGLPPEVKLLFATDMAEAADMPESFIQKLGDAVGQLIGAASAPGAPEMAMGQAPPTEDPTEAPPGAAAPTPLVA